MKRRGDEVQFGAARTPQRILTTQHSSSGKYLKITVQFE